MHKTQILKALREVFAYSQSTSSFLFGYIYKRKLNIKIKISTRAKPEKLALIYTLRFIPNDVMCNAQKIKQITTIILF